MNDSRRITQLEEHLTHLQKHVTEQDKVILELTDELARLRRELRELSARHESPARHPGAADDMPADEKPPHY